MLQRGYGQHFLVFNICNVFFQLSISFSVCKNKCKKHCVDIKIKIKSILV